MEILMNKNVNVYSFNEKCYVYLGDYIKLLKENKILKENAEHNDKVVDKVNVENQLLKKENKQLQQENEILKEDIKDVDIWNKFYPDFLDLYLKIKNYKEN